MDRRSFLSLLLGLAVLAGGGCGTLRGAQPQSPAPAPAPTAPATPPPTSPLPLSVTDDAGRTIRIEHWPQRLLSLAPSTTEILYAVGVGDRIVGTDSFSNYPADAKAKPKVGGIVDPDFEKMVTLQPDLAFVASGSRKLLDKLEELKIPVVVLAPKALDDVFKSLRLAASLTGVEDKAGPVIASLQRRRDAVTARTAGLPEAKRPLVFFEVWPEPLRSAGPGSFIDDVIRLAGGRNVAAATNAPWPEISAEAVVAANPELIITPFPKTVEELTTGARKSWASVAAVRDGRVRLIDQDLISRPGPRLIDALEAMAKLIHPELFGS